MDKFMRSEPLDSHSSEKVVPQYRDESTDALLKSHLASYKKDELVNQERDVGGGRSRLMRADTSGSLGNMYTNEYTPSRSSSRATLNSDNVKYSGSKSDVSVVSRERDRYERRHGENRRGSSSSHIGNSSSVDEYTSNRSYKQQQYDDHDSNARDSRRSSRSSLHSVHSNKPYVQETTSPPQPLLPSSLVRELSEGTRDDSEAWDSSSLSTHDSHGNITCYRGYTQRKSITSMDPRLPDSDLPRSRKSSRDETVESRARRKSRDETEIRMRRSSREELESRHRRTSRDENHPGGISRERRSSSVKEGKIHVSHRDLNSTGLHDHHGQGRSSSSLHDAVVSNGNRFPSEQSSRSRDYHRSHERSNLSHDFSEKSYDHNNKPRDYHRSQSSHEIRHPHRSRRQDTFSRDSHLRDSVRSHDSTRSHESSRSYYSDRVRESKRVPNPEWDSLVDCERYERRHRDRHYERSQPTIISEVGPDVIPLEAQPPEVDRGRRKSSFDRLATIHHEKFKISEY